MSFGSLRKEHGPGPVPAGPLWLELSEQREEEGIFGSQVAKGVGGDHRGFVIYLAT